MERDLAQRRKREATRTHGRAEKTRVGLVTLTVGASERKMPKECAFKPSRELAKG